MSKPRIGLLVSSLLSLISKLLFWLMTDNRSNEIETPTLIRFPTPIGPENTGKTFD